MREALAGVVWVDMNSAYGLCGVRVRGMPGVSVGVDGGNINGM